MSKRRQTTGLPPNFRYPLITPDHERDSFVGYESYDDDAGHSRDPQVVYPTYVPREKSPAPQLVRVAKQPEMIRKQSVHPQSGNWGTFDAANPLGDSKVPGSFQDTDAEDLEPEIIRAAPRGAYAHSAEIVDLYSDESDENLDFGHEEPLVFPQLPLEEVVLDVAYILRTKSNPPGEGYTYVLADPTGRNKFYKIGSAKNVSQRANEHRSACNVSYFRIQRRPATPLKQYKRLEKLTQAELINMSYDPNCTCKIPQRQYFWGREQTAYEILDFWSKWLTKSCPYDRNGHLLPFWEHRLRNFEADIQTYFDCRGAKCIKRTADNLACPICLRSGWKWFTEPSGRDKIEFCSRTQIGSVWVHKALLYLYKYIPVKDSVWVTAVDGIAQAVSFCGQFKSTAMLLNLLYARLLIPMLWSTIFTTAEYFSFLSMMEIVIFSVIYQLVRLELAQLAVKRRGSSKESRLVRRKALPSSLENIGAGTSEPKFANEPRILEMPDNLIQNVPKQMKVSSKGGSKKSDSGSILSPAEVAAARLKRYKPGRRRSDFAKQASKRIARACDACYKRKIKCDAAVPKCNWCSHHDNPCTFERKIRRTRKRVAGAKDAAAPGSQLSERIARIEKLLSEKLPQEPPTSMPQQLQPISNTFNLDYTPSPPAIHQSSASSSVPLHFAGRELGAISLFTGMPFILPEGQEWVQSRTGQKLAFDGFTSSRVPWEKQRTQNATASLAHLQSLHNFELPERSTLEANFELYRTSLMQRVFPVVDPVLFYSTISSAYKERNLGFNGVHVHSKASVFAFATFASMLCNPCLLSLGYKLPRLDEEACAAKARSLLFQVLQEPPTLEGLQAVTIIALIELVTGNLQSANYYGSISARMIFMLGGHIFTGQRSWLPHSCTDTEARSKNHLRNLFWLAYTIEQDVCLRTGQAQLFSEENCDLTLPPCYEEQMYATLEYHHNSSDLPENPIFPMDLRLSAIKSRAYTALYSFKAMKKTDAEILRDIRELDDELERWRLSVPVKWRPTLSFFHETPDPNCTMHSVILRLNYHLCMTIIHQASSRCKSWASDQGHIMDGVSSSLALSVEASRSTLLYLETSGHVLVDGVFWTLIFYPMSALLAIFCNILTNPAEEQASKDLALLKSATGMLERVFLRQAYSVNELVHVKLVADFVNELCRLAACAMDKAWRERGRWLP
ncbi:putative C6 transcription factor [Aspergillus stella-maris]|uniref:putative C6 transcription factor n=1 Tax=Aspergillus stella-maris TaxID=1810926 RepID=UPI003CCD5E28